MKGLKLDTGKLIGNTAGNGLALVGHTGLNRIPFVKNLSPVMRGLGTVVVARFGVPLLMNAMGFNKGKGANVAVGAEEGLATLGLAQLGNKVAPNLFPAISEVSGYEESPYVQGLGMVADEESVNGEESVEGYEDNVYM